MNRIQLCEEIMQDVQMVLKRLKNANLVNSDDLVNPKLTEIYQTTDIIGVLAFEIITSTTLISAVNVHALNKEAMSMVKDNFSSLIHFITFIVNEETGEIKKIRVHINYTDIDNYIEELKSICFREIGFKTYENFLKIFNKYDIDKIVDYQISGMQSYRYSDRVIQLKFGHKTQDGVYKMSTLRKAINAKSKQIKINGISHYKLSNDILIRFRQKQDVSLIIFEKFSDSEIGTTTVSDDSSIIKTHKFV